MHYEAEHAAGARQQSPAGCWCSTAHCSAAACSAGLPCAAPYQGSYFQVGMRCCIRVPRCSHGPILSVLLFQKPPSLNNFTACKCHASRAHIRLCCCSAATASAAAFLPLPLLLPLPLVLLLLLLPLLCHGVAGNVVDGVFN
jgi:hypothetical protein